MSAVTCRDIVRRALRMLSRVAAGSEATGDDLNDGLETLQAIYLEMQGQGLFGTLYDVNVTDATWDALPQQRIRGDRVGGITVNLPDLVDPESITLGCGYYDYEFRNYYGCGIAKPPRDGACIEINDMFSDLQQTWVYESSTARWIDLRDLNPAATAPLQKFSEGIACILASRIASEYGVPVPAGVAAGASGALYGLTHRNDGQRITQYAPERYF